jgi:TRAP-type transport system small permease protein
MPSLSTLIPWFDALIDAFCTAFAVLFGILTLLVCVEIVSRRLGMGSMPWLVDLIEYTLYGGTFLAAPWVLRQGEHVRVDLVLLSLPKAAAVRLEQIIDSIGFAVSVVMCYFGTAVAFDSYRANIIQYKNLAVHDWVLLLPIPIGCAMLAIEFALRISGVRGAVKETHTPLKIPGAQR